MNTLRGSELQECLALCEEMKRELKDSCYIPEERLSGEIREALRIVREYHAAEFEEIYKQILLLAEER